MSNLFTVLPFLFSNPALPVIPEEDMRRLAAGEPGAYDYWQFGGSANSLVGVQAGRPLVPQSGQPEFHPNYATLSAAAGSALMTGLGESVAQEDTIYAVIRVAPGSPLIIFGSLGTTGVGTGSGVFQIAGQALSQQHRGTNILQETGLTLTPGDWLFVALSRQFSVGANAVHVMVGGQPVATGFGTGVYAPSAGEIALGNAYYTSSPDIGPFDIAEFGVFPLSLDADGLEDLYLRVKARCAERGIAVV